MSLSWVVEKLFIYSGISSVYTVELGQKNA